MFEDFQHAMSGMLKYTGDLIGTAVELMALALMIGAAIFLAVDWSRIHGKPVNSVQTFASALIAALGDKEYLHSLRDDFFIPAGESGENPARQQAASTGAGATSGSAAAAEAQNAPPAKDGSTTRPDVSTVPPQPVWLDRLSWEAVDERDKITDKVTRKAVGGGKFEDGISLEASASCDGVMGFEFSLHTYRGDAPAPFRWNNDNKIGLRLRLDTGDARVATAQAQYTNEATIVFYDPASSRKALGAEQPGAQGQGLFGLFSGIVGGSMMFELANIAAGRIDELNSAQTARVELPLADGSANVVDLNPQDAALKSVISKCAADLRKSAAAAAQQASAAPASPAPSPGHYYAPSPGLAFIPPRDVTIPAGRSIKIYLTDDQASGVPVFGKITVLGQRYEPSRRGSLCIVRWSSNGQYVTGEIGISQLGAVLDPGQAKICYMPFGTPGGVNLSENGR
jgi:hypothetical protein